MKGTEAGEKFFTIHIGEESYRVRESGSNQIHIRKLESYLNNLIKEIREQFPAASTVRVLGILSIRLAEELLDLKKSGDSFDVSRLRGDIESLFQYVQSIVKD